MKSTKVFHRTSILAGLVVALLLLTAGNVYTVAQSGCYSHSTAYVTGGMNIRQSATTDSPVVATARSGDSFSVSQSQQGDDYCWLNVGSGWMAKTSRVSSTKPSPAARTQSGPTQPDPTPQAVQATTEVDNCCFTGWECDSDEDWTNGYWAFQLDRCDAPPYERHSFVGRSRESDAEYVGGIRGYEGYNIPGVEIRRPTVKEFCDALEALDLPLTPECEDQ